MSIMDNSVTYLEVLDSPVPRLDNVMTLECAFDQNVCE